MSLENSLTPAKNPIPIHQPLSLQASHYTDWGIPAICVVLQVLTFREP
jgi:hypothetical protein